MIISMPTTGRPQHRYDHPLRSLVQRTGDVTIATDLGVPRSTARGWLGKAPKAVVSLDVTDLSASALQQEVLELRRSVRKLTRSDLNLSDQPHPTRGSVFVSQGGQFSLSLDIRPISRLARRSFSVSGQPLPPTTGKPDTYILHTIGIPSWRGVSRPNYFAGLG